MKHLTIFSLIIIGTFQACYADAQQYAYHKENIQWNGNTCEVNLYGLSKSEAEKTLSSISTIPIYHTSNPEYKFTLNDKSLFKECPIAIEQINTKLTILMVFRSRGWVNYIFENGIYTGSKRVNSPSQR